MGVETNYFEVLHRLARRYVLGGLPFWDAITEAARLDPTSGIEAFKSSAVYQLEKVVTTLCAENRALKAELQELERRLDPSAAETESFEQEMASRLAREREAQEESQWNGTS